MVLDDFLIKIEQDIHTALSKIDINAKGFLVVVDETGHLLGTLTDGDIRRGLIRQQSPVDFFGKRVEDFCCRECTSIGVHEDFRAVIPLFKKKAIKFLPIVDENQVVVNVITKANMHGVLLKNLHEDLTYDFIHMDESMMDYEIYERPWGFYKTTIINDFYQSKVIEVKPEQALSLQMHLHREEHWIVVCGEGEVQIGESVIEVQGGSSLFIPKGCRHRLTNTSKVKNLTLVEVQRGDYFGEDDIIRFDDVYGRA